MPFVPPSTIKDVPGADRQKLQRLLYDREVLGYCFSYSKLLKLVNDVQAIKKCIVAFDPKEKDAEKDRLNDEITAIFSEHGILSMRDEDPFGRLNDCLYFDSTSTSFSKTRAVELAPKFKINPEALAECLEAATEKKPIVIFSVRPVKEQENGSAKKQAKA